MPFIQFELDRSGIDVILSRAFESSCLMVDFANRENNGRYVKLDASCIIYGIDISQTKVHGARN